MKSEREKMLAGELYNASDPELAAAREHARSLLLRLNTLAGDEAQRRGIAAALFGQGGSTAIVTPPLFCDYGTQVELGEHVFFNFNCVLLDVCRIRIGAHTLIGPAVQIYTALHPMDAAMRRTQESGKPVTIGSDVWIGGAAVILPGVEIGDRAVVGAGSVVTRSIPADVFAAGNPCRVMRAISSGAAE